MNGINVIPRLNRGIQATTTATALSIFLIFISAFFVLANPRSVNAQGGNVYGICICDDAPRLQDKTCSQFTIPKPESELSAACDTTCGGADKVDLFTATVRPLTCAEQIRCTLDPSKCGVEAGVGSADLIGELIPEIENLNRLGKGVTPAVLIGRIIRVVLQVVGSIALLVFVYGGIVWMTARGNAERTQRAIKVIVWAALGVVVILASYTLVEFIFGTLK